jgi:hypothetical protein
MSTIAPVFVKGQISLESEKYNLEFIKKNISEFGVMGLPWGPMNAQEHFGKLVGVTLKIFTQEPTTINAKAHLIRECTVYSDHMGLRLRLGDAERSALRSQIKRYGYFPTEYIRKYPRMPSLASIQTFPLHTMAYTEENPEQPMIFNIGNLSPNGILLSSESQLVMKMKPGDRLNVIMDPRGWFPVQVRFQGMICRITDDLTESGNVMRHLGVRMTKISTTDRTAFLDLLKDILSKMKMTSVAKVKPASPPMLLPKVASK